MTKTINRRVAIKLAVAYPAELGGAKASLSTCSAKQAKNMPQQIKGEQKWTIRHRSIRPFPPTT
jgi:hypothetical protein